MPDLDIPAILASAAASSCGRECRQIVTTDVAALCREVERLRERLASLEVDHSAALASIAQLRTLNESLAVRLHAAADALTQAALRQGYGDLGTRLRAFVDEFGAMVEGRRDAALAILKANPAWAPVRHGGRWALGEGGRILEYTKGPRKGETYHYPPVCDDPWTAVVQGKAWDEDFDFERTEGADEE